VKNKDILIIDISDIYVNLIMGEPIKKKRKTIIDISVEAIRKPVENKSERGEE
jgi:hypothetical protein